MRTFAEKWYLIICQQPNPELSACLGIGCGFELPRQCKPAIKPKGVIWDTWALRASLSPFQPFVKIVARDRSSSRIIRGNVWGKHDLALACEISSSQGSYPWWWWLGNRPDVLLPACIKWCNERQGTSGPLYYITSHRPPLLLLTFLPLYQKVTRELIYHTLLFLFSSFLSSFPRNSVLRFSVVNCGRYPNSFASPGPFPEHFIFGVLLAAGAKTSNL